MDLGLNGKAVLVTGASRGIGRGIAEGFVREGAHVVITARGAEGIDEAKRAIAVTHPGGRIDGVVADVSTREGAEEAVAKAAALLGGLDVLVNNVGGSVGAGPFDVADEAAWQRVIGANLFSAVWCSQLALPFFRAGRGGVIVHVGSISGREYASSAPYAAAKAALVGLTKEMGTDLAKHRVRVLSVAPGSILFPGGSWERRQRETPERIAKMIEEELPWKRFGTPEEIANVVVFVASERASWVTGTTIVVDGSQGRAN